MLYPLSYGGVGADFNPDDGGPANAGMTAGRAN